MPDYEFLEHTADLHMRVYGTDITHLFQNALKGMSHVIEPKITDQPIERKMDVQGLDKEDLLVNFLNECLANLDIYKEAYESAQFDQIKDNALSVKLSGHKISRFGTQIKGATHHQLSIKKSGGAFQADIIFDV